MMRNDPFFGHFAKYDLACILFFPDIFRCQALIFWTCEVYLIKANVRMIRLHFEKMKDSMNEVFMWFILITLENLHVELSCLTSRGILACSSNDLFN